MTKILFFNLFLIQISFSFTQNYYWVATVNGMDYSFYYSSMDSKGNLVGGSEARKDAYYHADAEYLNGDGTKFNYGSVRPRQTLVISFSPEGMFNWSFKMDIEYTELYGIAHDNMDNTVLLLEVFWYDDDDDDNPIGLIPEVSEETYLPSGFYLFYLDKHGKYLKHIQVFNDSETDIDVEDFQSYRDTNFLILGTVGNGPFCKELGFKEVSGGGDFVTVLGADGKPTWADVVIYDKETCCGSYADARGITTLSDGTIFMAGTVKKGATLYNSQKKFYCPPIADETQYNKPVETYLISYSPHGKVNWLKTSKTRVVMQAITADEEGVYVSYSNFRNESDEAFGVEVDTTNGKHVITTKFDHNGKALWSVSHKAKRTINTLSVNNELHVLLRNSSPLDGTVVNGSNLTRRAWMYLVRYSSEGEFDGLKEITLPSSSQHFHYKMFIGKDNRIYTMGELWLGNKTEFSRWETAFGGLVGYGGGNFPLVGRLSKF